MTSFRTNEVNTTNTYFDYTYKHTPENGPELKSIMTVPHINDLIYHFVQNPNIL